ncbi:hypothetical protein [Bradyrhizobium sp.]|uniref:hypothetical protein n=1 Tax=Bradyrhizobium sp. TaxID=376 RepID=UPI003BB05408
MVKLLTRLKVSEISAVDRGAGEGCKVLLWKRDDTPRAKMFDDIMKESDPRRTNTIEDDEKVSAKLKTFARLMVIADPSKTEEEHLYRLLHTARGVRRAEFMNSLSKNEKDNPPMTRTEEMATMRTFVKQGGMAAIAKRILETGGTSLNEMEYTTLVQEDASLKKISFEKAFQDPDTQRAYQVVRDATQVKTYLKSYPGMMSVEVVSTEVGSTLTTDDSWKAAAQLQTLVEAQRAKAPTLTTSALFEAVYSAPENKTLVARAHGRPDVSSTSGDELQAR